MRRFIIRVDGGREVGFGHVVRSMAVAKRMRTLYKVEAAFYSNYYEPLVDVYQQAGFEHVFNKRYPEIEFLCGTPCNSVVLIDTLFPYSSAQIQDIEDRRNTIMLHNDCEGVSGCTCAVFPIAHLDDRIVYKLQQSGTKCLHGFEYVIINEPVLNWHGMVGNHVAVTTGASDPGRMMNHILNWVNRSDIDIPVKFLYGFDFQYMPATESMKPHIQVKEFNYDDMLSAKLIVSAFGVTSYEAIYSNVPVVTIGRSTKNTAGSKLLQERYGCNYHLDLFQEEMLTDSIMRLWSNEADLNRIKISQKGLIDGKGTERLCKVIYEMMRL